LPSQQHTVTSILSDNIIIIIVRFFPCPFLPSFALHRHNMWCRSVGLLQRRLSPATSTSSRAAAAAAIATNVDAFTAALAQPSVVAPTSSQFRTYVSRAHPRPVPEFPVPIALQMVLDGIEQRKAARAERWEQNKAKRVAKGIQVRPALEKWQKKKC
jgi:hypothetical protein